MTGGEFSAASGAVVVDRSPKYETRDGGIGTYFGLPDGSTVLLEHGHETTSLTWPTDLEAEDFFGRIEALDEVFAGVSDDIESVEVGGTKVVSMTVATDQGRYYRLSWVSDTLLDRAGHKEGGIVIELPQDFDLTAPMVATGTETVIANTEDLGTKLAEEITRTPIPGYSPTDTPATLGWDQIGADEYYGS